MASQLTITPNPAKGAKTRKNENAGSAAAVVGSHTPAPPAAKRQKIAKASEATPDDMDMLDKMAAAQKSVGALPGKDARDNKSKNESKELVPVQQPGAVALLPTGLPAPQRFIEPVNPLAKLYWFDSNNGAFWAHILPHLTVICGLDGRTINLGFWPSMVDRATAPDSMTPFFKGVNFTMYGTILNRGTHIGTYGNHKNTHNRNMTDKYACQNFSQSKYQLKVRSIPIEILQRIGGSPTFPGDTRYCLDALNAREEELRNIYAKNIDAKSLKPGTFYPIFGKDKPEDSSRSVTFRTSMYIAQGAEAMKKTNEEREKQKKRRDEDKKLGIQRGEPWPESKDKEPLPIDAMPDTYDPLGLHRKHWEENGTKLPYMKLNFKDTNDEDVDMDLRDDVGITGAFGFGDMFAFDVTVNFNKVGCHGMTFYVNKIRHLMTCLPSERKINERILDSGEIGASNYRQFMPVDPEYSTGFMAKHRAAKLAAANGIRPSDEKSAPATPMPPLGPSTPLHPGFPAGNGHGSGSGPLGSDSMDEGGDGGPTEDELGAQAAADAAAAAAAEYD